MIYLINGPMLFTVKTKQGGVPSPETIHGLLKEFSNRINSECQLETKELSATLSFEATEIKLLDEATKQKEKDEQGQINLQ